MKRLIHKLKMRLIPAYRKRVRLEILRRDKSPFAFAIRPGSLDEAVRVQDELLQLTLEKYQAQKGKI